MNDEELIRLEQYIGKGIDPSTEKQLLEMFAEELLKDNEGCEE